MNATHHLTARLKGYKIKIFSKSNRSHTIIKKQLFIEMSLTEWVYNDRPLKKVDFHVETLRKTYDTLITNYSSKAINSWPQLLTIWEFRVRSTIELRCVWLDVYKLPFHNGIPLEFRCCDSNIDDVCIRGREAQRVYQLRCACSQPVVAGEGMIGFVRVV